MMSTSLSASVEAPSRFLCGIHGDRDADLHAFAVAFATPCRKAALETSVGVLLYDEVAERLSRLETRFDAGQELLGLRSSALQPRTLFAVTLPLDATTPSQAVAVLLRCTEDLNAIERLGALPEHPDGLAFVNWQTSSSAVSLDSSTCRLWDMSRSGSVPRLEEAQVIGSASGLSVGCADPLQPSHFVAAAQRDLHVFDARADEKALYIGRAHADEILDVDVNPNRPHTFVSSAKDARVRFWDMRRPQAPLQELAAHSHWIWSVKYNTLHDQLVLTGSSDCSVRLWSMESVSSVPQDELKGDSTASDRLLHSFEEHEESVYSVCWSPSDAWVFASLSYNGRVDVHHVPSAEKYRILL